MNNKTKRPSTLHHRISSKHLDEKAERHFALVHSIDISCTFQAVPNIITVCKGTIINSQYHDNIPSYVHNRWCVGGEMLGQHPSAYGAKLCGAATLEHPKPILHVLNLLILKLLILKYSKKGIFFFEHNKKQMWPVIFLFLYFFKKKYNEMKKKNYRIKNVLMGSIYFSGT